MGGRGRFIGHVHVTAFDEMGMERMAASPCSGRFHLSPCMLRFMLLLVVVCGNMYSDNVLWP